MSTKDESKLIGYEVIKYNPYKEDTDFWWPDYLPQTLYSVTPLFSPGGIPGGMTSITDYDGNGCGWDHLKNNNRVTLDGEEAERFIRFHKKKWEELLKNQEKVLARGGFCSFE